MRVADADGRQRERDRVAEQQDDHESPEHQRRDVLDQEGGHRLSPRPCAVRSISLGDLLVAARSHDLLGELFLERLLSVLLARIGDQSPRKRDALDQLGQALQR